MSGGKAVIVYGAGISGRGAADVLARRQRRVFLYNDGECEIKPQLAALLAACGGGVATAGFQQLLSLADMLVLSPCIAPEHPNVQLALQAGLEVISEVELAYRLYGGHMAAITGTNGKTTTTTIVGEMFKTLPVPTAVGGNIGQALSLEAEGLPDNAWLAAEISSFQLECVRSFAPEVAVVLNLTPDHIERHHTLAAYEAAKKNIFLRQTPQQVTVLNYDDPVVREWAADSKAQICYFSRKKILQRGIFIQDGNFVIKWDNKEIIVCGVQEARLFGGHNEENILAALACGFFAGVQADNMAAVLRSFQGVEHRLEYVATVRGVPYYNDSKATNTDSAIKALQAFAKGHLILLAGGHDKMTPLEPFMREVRDKADLLILLGEARARFYQAAVDCGVTKIFLADSFEEAVRHAYAVARKPQVVLLSPACSSFDMFRNYPERGRYFKRLVRELQQ